MITRRVRIQLLVFLLITAAGITYTGLNYIGFTRTFLGGRYKVVADLADSGGIFTNAEVTYRGVTVGRVGELHLTRDGVRVDLLIDKGTRVPADTVAAVRDRSAVGEQYVDLRPRTRGGPYLHDGSVIPRPRTSVPTSTTALLVNLDQLVDSVPKDDLTTVIDELNDAFEDTGPDLARLVEASNALIEEADANLPQTVRLIDDAKTVLDTQRDESTAIKEFARHLASLSDQIRESDPDLRGTLDHGVTASNELTTLLKEVRPTLPILLDNLTTTGQVVTMRLPGLEQVLVTYPLVVAASYTVAPGDGTAHFGLVLNVNAPPPCSKGYEGTKRRYPQVTSDVPAPRDASCKEPKDSPIDVRGSRNAPSPGTVPGPVSGSSSAAAFGGPAGGTARSPEAAPPPGQGPYVAGYDPATGRVIGPDGRPYVVGSVGGQQRVLGDDSWKWLLIGPLGR